MANIEKIKKNKSIQELLEFGIINIDKPSNPTSFDVSHFVCKTLKLRKTSHFGTLDPKVTGVLPVALNRACKLTGYFLGEDKEYVGVMRIHEDIPLEKIEKMIKEKFTGKILQTPPVRSRVKRQERQREVKRFEILEKKGQDILFVAEVQGGTYIRKLIDDLGRELGIGAHMLELRRVRAGIFSEKAKPFASSSNSQTKEYPSVNLYDFEKAVQEYEKGDEKPLRDIIIPGEIVSEVYPEVQINKEIVEKIFHGKRIEKQDLISNQKMAKNKIISVFAGDRFIGMFKVVNNEVFATPEFVMQPIKGEIK